MNKVSGLCCVVASAAMLNYACDEAQAPTPIQDTGQQGNADTNTTDAGETDGANTQTDTDPTSDTGEDAVQGNAQFGEPCQSNLDCESGYCITSALGFVCTLGCVNESDCPQLEGVAMQCQVSANFGADGGQICVPTQSSLCQPCFQDSNCFGGQCVAIDNGSVCGTDCEVNADCPDGSGCYLFTSEGDPLTPGQCLPDNMTCDCTSANAGEQRPCARVDNELGARCFGVETCDPQVGWTGCDASLPAPELCDGIDNDCNTIVDDNLPGTQPCERANDLGVCTGVALCEGEAGWVCQVDAPQDELCDLIDNDCDDTIDEDFVDGEGLYTDVANCGVCGNDCRERFALAQTTACQVIEGRAQCVITECVEGYALVGPNACLPLASSLCQPCGQDSDCNDAVGDACIQYEGGRFCGRDCSDQSPFGTQCPDGYTCDAEQQQCTLSTGTCLCGPDDNFLRACAIPDPNDDENNCVGQQTCSNGELSQCVPAQDECNGIDDDCDGIIDNGLRDPDSGQWYSDEHCGRCFNDCTTLFDEPALHAEGTCRDLADIRRGEPAECTLDCDDGYADVNRVTADGCECEIFDRDNDAPDPRGVDENCDGIDGEVARGWFVSATGDDMGQGTREDPLRTITHAISRASNTRDHVYVAAGVYLESLSLRAGISVFGGYSANFSRRDLRGNETAVFGQQPNEGTPGTITATDISNNPTIVSGLTIVGYDRFTATTSSYAVHITDCDNSLIVRNNVIRAGNGANGQRGSSGQAAPGAPDSATTGSPQRTAQQTDCRNNNQNRSQGGSGASHSCTDQEGDVIQTSGGNGGSADCPEFNQPEEDGEDGTPMGAPGGAGGYNQLLLQCAFCQVPDEPGSTEVGVPGDDGEHGTDGQGGNGCNQSAGRVVDGQWIAGSARQQPGQVQNPDSGSGGQGYKGDPGGGGGGGGGGSGVQRQPQYDRPCPYAEVIGGGGGGGGAGGCGGTGGTGGSPGGGSIGVMVFYTANPRSVAQIVDNVVERGFGGTGGDGGDGARGGEGSAGQTADALDEDQFDNALLVCSDPGGRGGDGGNGGSGGGGGGGCGGISTGIYVAGQGNVDTGQYGRQNQFLGTGSGGEGGRGGVSLGITGGNGAIGVYMEVAQ